jgi:FtsP/CotA-like multicopper oxidase with cupredoxin domain
VEPIVCRAEVRTRNLHGNFVRLVMRFDGYRGVYLIHCHNLEHEDGGMMLNFEIG